MAGEKETENLILIIDDDPEVVSYLEMVFKSKNYNIMIAYDGLEGLDILRKNLPDLILLDINLPGKNGYQICKIIKSEKTTRYIPVIMMTSGDDYDKKQLCYDSGADEFINKPFDIIELLTRVKVLLRIKKMQDELIEINKQLSQKVEEKTKNLETFYMETIKSLARAIDAKDHYTLYHSSRVAKFSVLIAKEMGLKDLDILQIKEAAELHDLGKIAVPDSILTKKEKLTQEEWNHIKNHSSAGANILRPLSFLGGAIEFIQQHHEKYDGSGYPFGNSGKNIPIGARIIAVADAYEAMISDRPYRKALTEEEAIEELKKNSGKQFDPDVVKVFLKILKKIKHKKSYSESISEEEIL